MTIIIWVCGEGDDFESPKTVGKIFVLQISLDLIPHSLRNTFAITSLSLPVKPLATTSQLSVSMDLAYSGHFI